MTDLPLPEPPMMTTDSPGMISRSMPFSTRFLPNRLCTPASWIFGISVIG